MGVWASGFWETDWETIVLGPFRAFRFYCEGINGLMAYGRRSVAEMVMMLNGMSQRNRVDNDMNFQLNVGISTD